MRGSCVRTVTRPWGRTCRNATISDEQQHLGDARGRRVLGSRLSSPSANAAITAPLICPMPPTTTTRNGVDDVVGAQRWRPGPSRVSATPAMPARPEPRKNVSRSVARVEMPDRLGQVAVLHRGADAPAERAEYLSTTARARPAQPTASARMNSRVTGDSRSRGCRPGRQPGRARRPRWGRRRRRGPAAGAPGATPNVTSSVSSGRWYMRRMSVISRIRPSRPADEEADRQRRPAGRPPRRLTTCWPRTPCRRRPS